MKTKKLPAAAAFLKKIGLSRGPIRKQILKYISSRKDDGTPFLSDFFGSPVVLYLDNNTDRKVLLTSNCRYDDVEINFLGSHMTKNGWFVDIGANSGLISVGVRAVSDTMRVLAIEPNPEMYRRAKHNLIELDPNNKRSTFLVEAALSENDGTVFLETINGYGEASISDEETGSTIEVPSRSFKSLVEEHEIEAIDALKIDIEGYEDTVIPMMFDTLSERLWPNAIVIETQADNEKSAAIQAIAASGYRLVKSTRSNLLFSRVA